MLLSNFNCPRIIVLFRYINLILTGLLCAACTNQFPTNQNYEYFILAMPKSSETPVSPASPGVLSITPTDGSTAQANNSQIQIIFLQTMDAASLTLQAASGACTESIQISDNNFGTCLGGTLNITGNPTIVITPSTLLFEGTNIQAKVTTTATSSGTALATDFISTGFTVFLPTDFAGLGIWLRSDMGVTRDGSDRISSWADQSGNGMNVTQGTASRQPLWVAGILNGNPIVRFDANRFLRRNNVIGSSLFASNQVDAFFVINQTGSQARNTILVWEQSSSNRVVMHMTWANQLIYEHGDGGGGGRVSMAQPGGWDSVFHISEVYRNANTAQWTVDGALAGNLTFSDNLANGGSTNLRIGQAATGTPTNGWFLGDLAELLIYRNALSAAERTIVACYLSRKYNLTLTPVCP